MEIENQTGHERLRRSTDNPTNGRLKMIHRWYVGSTLFFSFRFASTFPLFFDRCAWDRFFH